MTNDPAADGAKMDYAGTMTYADYLQLDAILNAQKPRSPDPNEWLFIIQHQTSELWMKLVLIELRAAVAAVAADDLPPAFKMLARVSRIFEQLVHAWSVLATMTPSEYSAIRPYLDSSSGFQSWQYREIEYVLGNKNPALLKAHAHRADIHARVEQASGGAVAVRRGTAPAGPPRVRHRPGGAGARSRQPHAAANDSVVAAWAEVYRSPREYWELYELAEELVDLEDAFRQWRFRHVTTVERIIGFKRGTGGTSGVSYLRRMLDVVLFPELWKVRTDL